LAIRGYKKDSNLLTIQCSKTRMTGYS